MLKVPTMGELRAKFVRFGPMVRQKLLVLDMDETMLHTKFYSNGAGEAPTGLHVVNGVLEFTASLNVNREEQNQGVTSLLLNVKIRQHLEDVLLYLSTLFEICVFTAGE
jgi:TFIIF-interacting CTD phosphatase-like protein